MRSHPGLSIRFCSVAVELLYRFYNHGFGVGGMRIAIMGSGASAVILALSPQVGMSRDGFLRTLGKNHCCSSPAVAS